MQPGVDESVKRGALKKLFSDPRFNVMDGLDVYIDDYSKPDPIDPAIVRTLAHARYIFNPPATRVTAEGYVEDVPEEELRTAERDGEAETAPEAVGQAAGAAPPGIAPQQAAMPPIAHEQAVAALSIGKPRVESATPLAQRQDDTGPVIAKPRDDAMPVTKAKPDA